MARPARPGRPLARAGQPRPSGPWAPAARSPAAVAIDRRAVGRASIGPRAPPPSGRFRPRQGCRPAWPGPAVEPAGVAPRSVSASADWYQLASSRLITRVDQSRTSMIPPTMKAIVASVRGTIRSRWLNRARASTPGGSWSRPSTVYGPIWARSRCWAVTIRRAREPRGPVARTAHSWLRSIVNSGESTCAPRGQVLEPHIHQVDEGIGVQLVGQAGRSKVELAADQAVSGKAGEVDEHRALERCGWPPSCPSAGALPTEHEGLPKIRSKVRTKGPGAGRTGTLPTCSGR